MKRGCCNDGSLDYGDSAEGRGKWQDSMCSIGTEPTWSIDEIGEGVRVREDEDNSKFFI